MIREVTAYEAFVILRNVFLFGSIFCFGYRSASALCSLLSKVLCRFLSVHFQNQKKDR